MTSKCLFCGVEVRRMIDDGYHPTIWTHVYGYIQCEVTYATPGGLVDD